MGEPKKALSRSATRSLGSTALRSTQTLTVPLQLAAPKSGKQVHHLQFRMPNDEVLPDTTAVEDDLRALNACFAQPQKSFGLDHRIQYLLEEAGQPTSRKPFYRLSQEPLILGAWERIARLDFTLETAADFASLLCGDRVGPRQRSMWASGPAGHTVVFENIAASRRWLSDLSRLQEFGLSPLQEAVMVYARTVIAHPFTNGNGRLARAMFYGPLARAGVLSTPCLALGAVFDRNREGIAQATTSVMRDQTWGPYTLALIASVRLAREVVSQDLTSLTAI